MLEIKNLEKKYKDKLILSNVNLKVNKGEVISIIGKSGCGKSTFLKCLNRLEPISSGNIYLNKQDITEMELPELRKKMGIVFQDYNLFDHLSVLDNLTLALIKIKKYSEGKAKKKAIQILKRFDLEEIINSYPDELSGGQKQRIAIARTLLMEPEIILLDEPTSALDKDMKKEVLDMIKELANGETTIIIVSHEEEFINSISKKIYKINRKKLVLEK